SRAGRRVATARRQGARRARLAGCEAAHPPLRREHTDLGPLLRSVRQRHVLQRRAALGHERQSGGLPPRARRRGGGRDRIPAGAFDRSRRLELRALERRTGPPGRSAAGSRRREPAGEPPDDPVGLVRAREYRHGLERRAHDRREPLGDRADPRPSRAARSRPALRRGPRAETLSARREAGAQERDRSRHIRRRGAALRDRHRPRPAVTLGLRSAAGTVSGEPRTEALEPGESRALFIEERFDLAREYEGTLELESTQPLAALALRSTTSASPDLLFTPYPGASPA